jgi:hypothetical protein
MSAANRIIGEKAINASDAAKMSRTLFAQDTLHELAGVGVKSCTTN